MKEVEDSSPVDHTSTKVTLLLSESISTTLQQVSHPQVSHERGRRFLHIHTYSSASFHHPCGSNNQDYSCTYPQRIEHAGTVEKGKDNDKERNQGQPEAIASPEKVEKEVKKTRGASHLEKFEVRAPDGHHRDCILLLLVGLARKVPLFVFLFLSK